MSNVVENENEAAAGFYEDDFQLKANTEQTKIDTNFASMGYWKEVRARFFSNKSAVFSLSAILIIIFFAFIGPKMTKYTYSGQNLSQKNYAPRIPGFDETPVFNGNEKLNTTTGSKIINGYKSNGNSDVYSVLMYSDAISGPAHGWERAYLCISHSLPFL